MKIIDFPLINQHCDLTLYYLCKTHISHNDYVVINCQNQIRGLDAFRMDGS